MSHRQQEFGHIPGDQQHRVNPDQGLQLGVSFRCCSIPSDSARSESSPVYSCVEDHNSTSRRRFLSQPVHGPSPGSPASSSSCRAPILPGCGTLSVQPTAPCWFAAQIAQCTGGVCIPATSVTASVSSQPCPMGFPCRGGHTAQTLWWQWWRGEARGWQEQAARENRCWGLLGRIRVCTCMWG